MRIRVSRCHPEAVLAKTMSVMLVSIVGIGMKPVIFH